MGEHRADRFARAAGVLLLSIGALGAVTGAAGAAAAAGAGTPAATSAGPPARADVPAAATGTATATATAPASAADAQALARVERALAALESVRAEFVQELVDPRTKTTQRAKGTLSLKKPGKFRWDYTQPAQVIVSDGERLWLYDADLEQVTVRRVKDTLSQTPAMLLSGQGRVRDGFTVRAAPPADGLEWVRLLPKRSDTDFRELRLGFSGDALQRMEFEDKLNQQTRIELKRVQRNVRLDDSLFRFVPPPGTDVIGPAS